MKTRNKPVFTRHWAGMQPKRTWEVHAEAMLSWDQFAGSPNRARAASMEWPAWSGQLGKAAWPHDHVLLGTLRGAACLPCTPRGCMRALHASHTGVCCSHARLDARRRRSATACGRTRSWATTPGASCWTAPRAALAACCTSTPRRRVLLYGSMLRAHTSLTMSVSCVHVSGPSWRNDG